MINYLHNIAKNDKTMYNKCIAKAISNKYLA